MFVDRSQVQRRVDGPNVTIKKSSSETEGTTQNIIYRSTLVQTGPDRTRPDQTGLKGGLYNGLGIIFRSCRGSGRRFKTSGKTQTFRSFKSFRSFRSDRSDRSLRSLRSLRSGFMRDRTQGSGFSWTGFSLVSGTFCCTGLPAARLLPAVMSSVTNGAHLQPKRFMRSELSDFLYCPFDSFKIKARRGNGRPQRMLEHFQNLNIKTPEGAPFPGRSRTRRTSTVQNQLSVCVPEIKSRITGPSRTPLRDHRTFHVTCCRIH